MPVKLGKKHHILVALKVFTVKYGSIIPVSMIALSLNFYQTFAVDYYTNSNRDLFVLPTSAAVARSDLALARDGAPNSNPANSSATQLICASSSTKNMILQQVGTYG